MEQGMKKRTRRSLVAAAMALGFSGVALADNNCYLRTLQGTYVFAANGYNIVGGAAQPKAIVEVIDFNGDGTLSVRGATLSANGMIVRTPSGGTGTYTVGASCTGTIAFAIPTFDIFISPGGEKLWMIQANTMAAEGRFKPAQELRERALEVAPTIGGITAVQLFAQRTEPLDCLGLQAAVGQFLNPISEPVFEEAAVIGRRLALEEIAPLLLQLRDRQRFQGRHPRQD